jgi:hypothetical protein
MICFTINDGYYDNGKQLDNLILEKGDRFIWDIHFTLIGQYYFALVIDVKNKIKIIKGDLKIGIILENGPIYIGLSNELGKIKKGLFEVHCGKIIVDDPAIYHLFVESQLSTIEINKLIIKFFPIPMQGSLEKVLDIKKNDQFVILESVDDVSKHSKVVILKPIDIPNNMWSYYQSFRIIKNYPFTYYAINFGLGNLGIKYNQDLSIPLLTLTIFKKCAIEIIDQDLEFKLINLESSQYLRFERDIKEDNNFNLLIRVRHIEVDGSARMEYQFYYGNSEVSMNHVLTVRFKTENEKKVYEFYIENLGNINGHIYRRELEVDPGWALTYDLKLTKVLTKNVFKLKEQNARCQIKNNNCYIIKYAGLGYSGDQETNLEISLNPSIKIPRLGLLGLNMQKKKE